MLLYKQATKNGEAEIEIERSRFIAHVYPVETREEADGIIKQLRKEYRDATHNVPALVLRDRMQIQWASDDGEPQGTSGAPMLMKMVGEGITNTLIVVTRYFGGTKLGTGGLVRAYTKACEEGLKAAGISEIVDVEVMTLKIGYSYFTKVQNSEKQYGYRIMDTVYEDNITVKAAYDPEDAEKIKDFFVNMTSGSVEIISVEKTTEKVPIIH